MTRTVVKTTVVKSKTNRDQVKTKSYGVQTASRLCPSESESSLRSKTIKSFFRPSLYFSFIYGRPNLLMGICIWECVPKVLFWMTRFLLLIDIHIHSSIKKGHDMIWYIVKKNRFHSYFFFWWLESAQTEEIRFPFLECGPSWAIYKSVYSPSVLPLVPHDPVYHNQRTLL